MYGHHGEREDIALTRRTFVGKVMPLLLNMLSRLVITFLPRSKRPFLIRKVEIRKQLLELLALFSSLFYPYGSQDIGSNLSVHQWRNG